MDFGERKVKGQQVLFSTERQTQDPGPERDSLPPARRQEVSCPCADGINKAFWSL
jgi:hypothetical protein